MLDLADRIELPRGVRLEADAVVDDVRRDRFPANAAALAVLGHRSEPLAVAARDLSERWGLSPEQARADVLSFAWFLSAALLVNVRPGRSRRARALAWLVLAVRLLPIGRLPDVAPRRAPLDTSSPARALVTTACGMARRVVALSLVLLVALVPLWLVAGRTALDEAASLAGAAGAALLVHEVAHAVALAGVPAALVCAGPRTLVLHPMLPARRARLVALAGPALPTLLGVALATSALSVDSPTLALVACALGGHALSVTVACRDGRTACGL
ncbi:MAG: hypothetical protein ACRC50_01425 [Gaiella sp.]